MKIVCPQCEFSRNVPAEKLPARSVMATCPQCQHRFRVSCEDEEAVMFSDKTVPQGAHIPSSNEPLYTQNQAEPKEQIKEEQVKNDSVPYELSAQDAENIASQDQAMLDDEISPEDRQKAAAAYAEQSREVSFAVANPWEYAKQSGYFTAFYQTVIWILFSPARFFAGLIPQNSRTHILLFYLIVRVIQISVEYFWGGVLSSSLEPDAVDDTELATILSLLTPQSDLMLTLLLGAATATIEIFFGSLFYFFMFKLVAKSKANFSLVFQVVAYSAAPLLLAVIPAIGTIVGFIWSIACLLIGCRYTMRLTWPQTILGVAPLYALGLLTFGAMINGVVGNM